MSEKLFIKSSCIIRNQKVFKNDELIFENNLENTTDFLISIYKHLGMEYPKFYKMDNLCKLGILAAECVVGENNKEESDNEGEIAVIIYNANSSLDNDIKYFSTVNKMASPALFVYTLPNIVIGEICIRHRIHGENTFFISKEFDIDQLESYVNLLFINNTATNCLCGWVDCLAEQYEAILFWVNKINENNFMQFNKENIIKNIAYGNGEVNSRSKRTDNCSIKFTGNNSNRYTR